MPPHRVTAVSPRQRHRNLATDTAGTHEYRVPGPALEVKNLQPLTDQRVERMSDDNETQIITGRCGTMPPPSEYRADAACRWPSECTRAEPASGPSSRVCGAPAPPCPLAAATTRQPRHRSPPSDARHCA